MSKNHNFDAWLDQNNGEPVENENQSTWLKKNTLLFKPINTLRMLDDSYINLSVINLSVTVFKKMYPAAGYDHITKRYYGNKEVYEDRIKGKSKNTASFFGATGLEGKLCILYLIKVPIMTLLNFMRFLVEFPVYFLEEGSRRLFVTSKLKHFDMGDRQLGWKALAGLGIVIGAVGYYLFKAIRLAIRLVTAPVESARAAWYIHPVFGIISGLLSIAAYVALSVFALPAIVSGLGNVGSAAGAHVALMMSKKVAAVKGLFPAALSTITALIALVGMGMTTVYQFICNKLHNRQLPDPATAKKYEEIGVNPNRLCGQSSKSDNNRSSLVYRGF